MVLAEVAPRLFLGDAHAASDAALLRRSGITHIVRCGCKAYHGADSFLYHHFALRDGEADAHRFGAAALPAIGFIAEALRGGEHSGVLVHCKAGMCRSPSLVIAYLHGCGGMTIAAASELVSVARPKVRPRASFLHSFQLTWAAAAATAAAVTASRSDDDASKGRCGDGKGDGDRGGHRDRDRQGRTEESRKGVREHGVVGGAGNAPPRPPPPPPQLPSMTLVDAASVVPRPDAAFSTFSATGWDFPYQALAGVASRNDVPAAVDALLLSSASVRVAFLARSRGYFRWLRRRSFGDVAGGREDEHVFLEMATRTHAVARDLAAAAASSWLPPVSLPSSSSSSSSSSTVHPAAALIALIPQVRYRPPKHADWGSLDERVWRTPGRAMGAKDHAVWVRRMRWGRVGTAQSVARGLKAQARLDTEAGRVVQATKYHLKRACGVVRHLRTQMREGRAEAKVEARRAAAGGGGGSSGGSGGGGGGGGGGDGGGDGKGGRGGEREAGNAKRREGMVARLQKKMEEAVFLHMKIAVFKRRYQQTDA